MNVFDSKHDEGVSVVLPVRNQGWLASIGSTDLLASMLPDDEMLIVDDGSSGDTPSVISALAEQFPQIRVVTTKGIGLVGALTLGIEQARHTWIARADADDRYPVDRLAVQRAARAPGVAAITGDYRVTGPPNGGTIPCALGQPFVALSLVHPQRFPHPGVMFHRDAVFEAGGYRVGDYPAEDLGLWMRLAHVGNFIGVPHVVVDWRMNPTSITHTTQVAQRSMTQKLLDGFSLPEARAITDDDVEEELLRYREVDHSFERALLLTRDLWAGRRLGVPASTLRPVLAHLGVRPGSSIRALRDLNRQARSRQAFRESMTT